MIVVCIGKSGITLDGHANYEEPGKDIICAAVSVLAQNLIRSLESLTHDAVKYRIKPGHIDIEYGNLSEHGKVLVDSFFIGIVSIKEAYGDEYVQINQHGAGRA